MLDKASEIPREIMTDDFPTARGRQPIRNVVGTSHWGQGPKYPLGTW